MGPFHIGEPPQFISMAVHIRCVGAAAQHSVNDGSYLCPGDRIYGRNVPSKNPPIQPYWAALVTWVQNQSSSFASEKRLVPPGVSLAKRMAITANWAWVISRLG